MRWRDSGLLPAPRRTRAPRGWRRAPRSALRQHRDGRVRDLTDRDGHALHRQPDGNGRAVVRLTTQVPTADFDELDAGAGPGSRHLQWLAALIARTGDAVRGSDLHAQAA